MKINKVVFNTISKIDNEYYNWQTHFMVQLNHMLSDFSIKNIHSSKEVAYMVLKKNSLGFYEGKSVVWVK